MNRSCRRTRRRDAARYLYVFSQFNKAQMRVAIGAVLVLAVVIVVATQQLDVVTDWIEDKDYRPGIGVGPGMCLPDFAHLVDQLDLSIRNPGNTGRRDRLGVVLLHVPAKRRLELVCD